MIIRRCALLVVTLCMVSACGMEIVTPEDPTTFIPDRSGEVKVGQMERAAVRSVLGAPQLSSMYWGFDLFRTDTEQFVVPIVFAPWPIPIGRQSNKLYRYTLVAYDAGGLASAVATGLFRREGWLLGPIKSDFPRLNLRAGELMFFIDNTLSQELSLLLSPPGRDDFLQNSHSSTNCTIVLGCGNRGCGDQLAVDAGSPRTLPVRSLHALAYLATDSSLQRVESINEDTRVFSPYETLVAVKLSLGEHVLEFSSTHFGGSSSLKFMCSPDKVSYLVINATGSGRNLVDWQIERTDTMPEHFARRPLSLLFDGQWYVDAEPGK